jgi:hypothetical protein
LPKRLGRTHPIGILSAASFDIAGHFASSIGKALSTKPESSMRSKRLAGPTGSTTLSLPNVGPTIDSELPTPFVA